jgi:transposase-like protein
MNYETLKSYVEQGLSIRKIAEIENKSFSAIQHWLSKFNLKTKGRKLSKIPACEFCGEPIKNYRSPKKFCNQECSSKHQRSLSFDRVEAGNAGPIAIRNFLLCKANACSCCGFEEWMGKAIPLEVDHIDGNAQNNELDNLRLLCPNCHAQTDTYKSKNRGKGRHYRTLRFKEGKSY